MRLESDRGLQLILVLGLAACGGAPAAKTEPTKTAAPEATRKVAEPEPAKPRPLAGDWKPHTSDGGFTIELPGTPKLESANINGFDFHDATVALPGRDVSVSATWSSLPGEDVEVGDTESMLEGAVKGLTQQAGGTLVGQAKPISIEHHPGREFELTAPIDGKTNTFRVRLYVVHDRQFRLVARTGPNEDFAAETDKMFASFTLTPEYSALHTEVVKFDWQTFKSADGGFTAKFPVAKPRVTTDTVNGQKVTTVVGSALQSYAVFVVGYFDVAGDAAKLKPEELFTSLRESSAAATGSKLVGQAEPAPLGTTPGEKFTLESEGGLMHIEGRSYLHGKRLYFLQAQRPHNSTVAQAEFDTFFAGFVPGKKK